MLFKLQEFLWNVICVGLLLMAIANIVTTIAAAVAPH
jgi:hypothetical protein